MKKIIISIVFLFVSILTFANYTITEEMWSETVDFGDGFSITYSGSMVYEYDDDGNFVSSSYVTNQTISMFAAFDDF